MKTLATTLCIMLAMGLFPTQEGQCLAATTQSPKVLISSYFQYVLSQQIPTQAAGLAAEAPEPVQAQVNQAASRWTGDLIGRLRADLEQQLGQSARDQFQSFVAAYTTAEQTGDIAYLRQLARNAGLTSPLPTSYAEFHRLVTTGWLKTDVDSGAALLGEIQTWLDVSAKKTGVPPLDAWLGRHSKMETASTTAKPPPKPSRRDALRNAEADAGSFNESTPETPAALDSFTQARQERRQRALDEAQAGMQQVALERETAEREMAAKKTAAAQAEAEAIKRQADKLASAETEALEQRKNSWGNKLKGVLSATVGAATGAFSGGIGTEAGSRLANAIFDHH